MKTVFLIFEYILLPIITVTVVYCMLIKPIQRNYQELQQKLEEIGSNLP